VAKIRIALVDDHPLFRSALAGVLRTGSGYGEIEIVEAGSLDVLIGRLDTGAEIDLLLLDLGLPGLHGLIGLLSFRSAYPAVPVIVVSARTEAPVPGRCMMLGAAGFIPKSSPKEQIREAVRAVLAGERWLPAVMETSVGGSSVERDLLSRLGSLSRREMQVCLLIGKGLLNRQIALELDITEATIKAHVSRVLQKLHASSRTQAVVMLQQLDDDAAGGARAFDEVVN